MMDRQFIKTMIKTKTTARHAAGIFPALAGAAGRS
jgi:hypothetical protein